MQIIITFVLVWLALPAIVVGQDVDKTDVTAILNRWHEAVESQPEYRANLKLSVKDIIGETVSEFYLHKSAARVVLHGVSRYTSSYGKTRRHDNFSETKVWSKETLSLINHTEKCVTVYRLIDIQEWASDKHWWNWFICDVYHMLSSMDEIMPLVLGVDPIKIDERFDVTVVPADPPNRGVILKFVPNGENVGGMFASILAYIPEGQLTPSHLKYFVRDDLSTHCLVRIAPIAEVAYAFPEVAAEDLQKRGYAIQRITRDFADRGAAPNATVPAQPTE